MNGIPPIGNPSSSSQLLRPFGLRTEHGVGGGRPADDKQDRRQRPGDDRDDRVPTQPLLVQRRRSPAPDLGRITTRPTSQATGVASAATPNNAAFAASAPRTRNTLSWAANSSRDLRRAADASAQTSTTYGGGRPLRWCRCGVYAHPSGKPNLPRGKAPPARPTRREPAPTGPTTRSAQPGPVRQGARRCSARRHRRVLLGREDQPSRG